MSPAGLLPLAVLVLLTGAQRLRRGPGEAALREDLLGAALILGVVVGLGTELLGAIHGITFAGVLVFWLAVLASAAAFLSWSWRKNGPAPAPQFPRPGAVDALLLGGLFAFALALFVVAWLAPPQSSDSLGYHMARVMHWIQDRSLAPYPTTDSPQLFDPPFAEMVRLHLFLLSGSDRSGCLLQWFAAVGALAAASLLAQDLGGGRRAQIFAAVFAGTLPIGLTQATSGKNGWVETLWLLALAHFSGAAGPLRKERPAPDRVLASFAAFGLELMTKITSWFFALPVAILAVVRAIRPGDRRVARSAAAGAFLACALTIPFLGRNLFVFRNPVADPVFRSHMGLASVTPAIVISNAVRNAASQLGTTNLALNAAMLRWVVRVHSLIGANAFDRRTTVFTPFGIVPSTRIEEFAHSPVHLLLVFGAGAALLLSRRLRQGGSRLPYLAVLVGGYVLFCATVRWQMPNSRLLMPLLVLAAPLVSVVAADVVGERAVPAIAAVLFAAGAPYAVRTAARPLSFEPGTGVLATPRTDLYFARVPALKKDYEDVARSVLAANVRNLGIVTAVGQPEYLLWMLLRGARPPVRIENVAVRGAAAGLASRPPFAGFRPELVVVFAPDPRNPRFDPKIAAAGAEYELVRASGSAGFYAPVTGRRNP